MKAIIITGALCIATGATLGWIHASDKCRLERMETKRQQAAAETERREQLATLSRNYYEAYQDAVNREPDTVERRVYVKADCVPAGAASGMGDAASTGGREADSRAVGSAGKVALTPATVDAVVAVADKHQRLYDMCRIKLEYFQNAYGQ